jgi:hypothetical protein
MASVYEIPLTAQAQTFSVSLAGVEYTITLAWRDADEGGWFLDLADAAGNVIVSGIPLVTGADLLGQYRYLGIGGGLQVQSDGDPDAVPTYTNLGATSHLYFVTV